MIQQPPEGHTKKILVIGGQPESLLNFRVDLLRSMVEAGYRVSTAASAESSSSAASVQDVTSRLQSLGITHHPIPMQPTGNNPLKDLETLQALVALCRSEKPDIVFAYTAKAVIYGIIAARWCKVPRRVAMLTGLPYGLASNTSRKGLSFHAARCLFRIAFHGCHSLIFHNDDDRQTVLEARLPPRIETAVVQGSGVDLEHFRPVPLPEGPTTFLMIARLIREKGVYEFLAASRLVKRSYPEARFLLVGGLYDRLDAVKESEIRTWQKEGIGEWLGSLEDVRPAIGQCSVFVLPSYHEGLPRSVLEAMAMNRAIVTTDAPGCRETVQEGRNGFLVPVGDSAALEKAMSRFLEEPDLVTLFGKESRTLAEARYDVHHVSMETLRIISVNES